MVAGGITGLPDSLLPVFPDRPTDRSQAMALQHSLRTEALRSQPTFTNIMLKEVYMKITSLLIPFLIFGLLAMTGCSSGLDQASGLINALKGSLGINQSQAIAGAGSLLGLASEKLGSQDFMKIANAIPGSNDLMKQAGDLTGLGKNFGSLANVTTALGKMGLTPDQVLKMGGSIADFAGKAGGESVQNMLMGVLK